MGVQLRIAGIGGAVTLPLALASCDKNPSRPTPLTPANPPSAPTLARVEVTAPASIPPGQSVQLTAAVSGTGEGLTTMTLDDGRCILLGVGGRIRLHARKEGYSNRVETLDVVASIRPDFERMVSTCGASRGVSGARDV
jgi:hypothetical protein